MRPPPGVDDRERGPTSHSSYSHTRNREKAQVADLGLGSVDLTCQHKNHTLLVEGPEITVRPVGTRRVTAGSR